MCNTCDYVSENVVNSDDFFSLPNDLRALYNRVAVRVRQRTREFAKAMSSVANKIESEADIPSYKSELNFQSSSYINDYSTILYNSVVEARQQSVDVEINRIGSQLQAYDSNMYNEYVLAIPAIVRLSRLNYFNRTNTIPYYTTRVSSKTTGYKLSNTLKTIKSGTDDIVEAIIRNGIRAKKSSFQIAKDIENFILKDKRRVWVTPKTILNRELGIPITKPYVKGAVPLKGSVDYNALRIARTELAYHYRIVKVESAKNKPWVIGYRWVLSSQHPKQDICDDWALNDEGYGLGVYINGPDVTSKGHPNCLCLLILVTIFDRQYEDYFAKAEKAGIIPPIKTGIPTRR